jgi:hypothetical protein
MKRLILAFWFDHIWPRSEGRRSRNQMAINEILRIKRKKSLWPDAFRHMILFLTINWRTLIITLLPIRLLRTLGAQDTANKSIWILRLTGKIDLVTTKQIHLENRNNSEQLCNPIGFRFSSPVNTKCSRKSAAFNPLYCFDEGHNHHYWYLWGRHQVSARTSETISDRNCSTNALGQASLEKWIYMLENEEIKWTFKIESATKTSKSVGIQ